MPLTIGNASGPCSTAYKTFMIRSEDIESREVMEERYGQIQCLMQNLGVPLSQAVLCLLQASDGNAHSWINPESSSPDRESLMGLANIERGFCILERCYDVNGVENGVITTEMFEVEVSSIYMLDLVMMFSIKGYHDWQ
ncbi:UNVERIFIED_CONTAM: hypothetical protein K2H54_037382 [Gekko kuhli]